MSNTRRARAVGFSIAGLAVLVDQADKVWMLDLYDIEAKGRAALNPFLDLVMVWNRGVSYGLFPQGSELGRWLLVALGIVGALLFSWWLWITRGKLATLALGLIIGGAISNVIDRLAYGAVADFFLLHVGRFEWYVFNLADVWIVAGAIGLVLAWALERPEIATET
jgi:signal peptidase II